MNAIAEGDATQPDAGNRQGSEAGKGSLKAPADVSAEEGEVASASAGTSGDTPADDTAAAKSRRTKQKGRVLTSPDCK